MVERTWTYGVLVSLLDAGQVHVLAIRKLGRHLGEIQLALRKLGKFVGPLVQCLRSLVLLVVRGSVAGSRETQIRSGQERRDTRAREQRGGGGGGATVRVLLRAACGGDRGGPVPHFRASEWGHGVCAREKKRVTRLEGASTGRVADKFAKFFGYGLLIDLI